MEDPRKVPVVVGGSTSGGGSSGVFQNFGRRLGIGERVGATKSEDQPAKQKVKELEVVSPANPLL
jgi:hypothetical protein